MAMYHGLFPSQLPSQQKQEHQIYILADGPAKQRPLICHSRGATHREKHHPNSLKCPAKSSVGMDDIPSSGTPSWQRTKGIHRGRTSYGPRGGPSAPFPLHYHADGGHVRKYFWNQGLQRRQHEFYPKLRTGCMAGMNAISNGYGNGQGLSLYERNLPTIGCLPSQSEGLLHHSSVHGSKRCIQIDRQLFACRRAWSEGTDPMATSQNPYLGNSSGVLAPTPPDRFLSCAQLMNIQVPPAKICTGGEWDKLSKGLWEKFIANQQTVETFKKKMQLWKNLYVFIKKTFGYYGLFVVGSTMSGFGSDSSDVDMCLLVRYSEMDQRNEAVGHLEKILRYLKKFDFVHNPELIQAKVPILKFKDSIQGLEVDLNCNNSVGIRNTHLLYCYSQLDWRVKPLVLNVKLWAVKHNINDAKNMTISSYSLALMVINYLQCGVTPPVLPCLHNLYQDKFSRHSDIHQINLLEEMLPYVSKNNTSLGELFLGFLYYYAFIFDFNREAVSVRMASRISIDDCRRVRSYKNDHRQWKYLCIEEPFDLTNTARSVYDRDVFERVKHVFRSSWQKLNDAKVIDCLFED